MKSFHFVVVITSYKKTGSKNLKITLINPPVEDFYVTGIRRQPLGLLYIAAALKVAGYSPDLINCHSAKKSRLELPPEFRYLEKYIGHPDPELRFPYGSYTHYGMSWQEIEKRIKEAASDIYFISSLFTTYYRETDRVIELVKKQKSSALIAVGGYHPSLYPDYYLDNGLADFVIAGEGEISSVRLVKAIEKGDDAGSMPGVLVRDSMKREISARPDVAQLPYPERSLLKGRDFRAYRKIFISMITSRGCPNSCSFCTGKIIWGAGRRERSAGDVLGEIESCVTDFGGGIINFEDDNIFPSRERAVELLELLISLKEKKYSDLEFTAMNGISIERIDPEIIMLMKRAGFGELNISLVTHSSALQKSERRPFSSGKFMEIAEAARSEGMNVRGYFILGLPGQSAEEAESTIGFLKGIGVKVFPSVFYNIYSPEKEWMVQRSSAFYNESPIMKREDLLRCFNRSV